MKNKILFIPENLNIITYINNDEILTPEQRRLALMFPLRVLYPVSRIIMEYKYNKSLNDDEKENIWVALNTEILINIITKKFYWVLPFLYRNGIIVRDPKRNYKVGEHSYFYRLADKYIQEFYSKKYVNITTDKTLYNNLCKEIDLSTDLNNFIYNNLLKLEMNMKETIDILNEKLGGLSNEIEKNGGKYIYNYNIFSYVPPREISSGISFINKCFIDEYFDSLKDIILLNKEEDRINLYNSWYSYCNKLVEKDLFLKVGKHSGRVFTNLTSIPRELRKSLYLPGGEDLYEIDIRNSQPVLFNYFLKKEYNLDRYLFENQYEDVKKYIDLTEKGLLYDYLMELWDIKDRNSFKKCFFGQVFYCKSESNFRYEYSKKFAELFPNVMKLILKMKEGSYKNLAIQLQKLESDIIIYGIIDKMKGQDDFIASIHDSLIVEESLLKSTVDMLNEELKSKGINATLKVKKITE